MVHGVRCVGRVREVSDFRVWPALSADCAYGNGNKENSAAREEGRVVERLPDGISAPLEICVEGHLCAWDGMCATPDVKHNVNRIEQIYIHRRPSAVEDGRTSVSNQNFSGNCKKIFVYVPCRPVSAITHRPRPFRSQSGSTDARTIDMLWIASCFQAGRAGTNLTSSCCNTPRLKVHNAYSADRLVPSASVTVTPFFDVRTSATVAFSRTCCSARNSAASDWISVLNPR